MNFISNSLRLLGLLYTHSKELFKPRIGVWHEQDENAFIDKYLDDNFLDLIFEINIKTGEDNKLWYWILNESIDFPYSIKEEIDDSHLDYKSCKKVVEDYEMNLLSNDSDLDSFD